MHGHVMDRYCNVPRKRSAATAQYVLLAGVTQANSAHVESIHRATPIKSVETMFVRSSEALKAVWFKCQFPLLSQLLSLV